MMALNSAINKNLTNQKAVSRQTSSERINPPVIRQAAHTFTKHLTYKEAKYDGYWLNGKPHGRYFTLCLLVPSADNLCKQSGPY